MTIVLFAALVWKVTDLARLLRHWSEQQSAIVTQLFAWAVGIAAVALGAHSAITQAIVVPGTGLALGALDAGSTILAGMVLASVASVGVDLKQSFDSTDSAAKPKLL